MKKIKIHLFFFCLLIGGLSTISFAQGLWQQAQNYGGTARLNAAGFSIGTKGYIGTGYDAGGYRQDFWAWDQSSDSWSQIANFPGAARDYAVGLSIGTKGYIGTGSSTAGNFYNDFWEYDGDPISPYYNTWVQKTSFSGGERNTAVGFSIGVKGYIGTGAKSTLSALYNDFWEYDPADASLGNDVNGNPMGKWTQRANFPIAIRSASGFSIGTKGYIGTGANLPYSVLYNLFYEWDGDIASPYYNTWVQKTNFGGVVRMFAEGFSIGTKGYIGTGTDGSTYYKDFWEYDPADASLGNDMNGNPMGKWTQKADMCSARAYAVGFSIGTKGYIGTGYEGTYKQDFYQYDPSGSGTPCLVFPIELLSFSASWLSDIQTDALLQWATASELNNDYFTPERSPDGINFTALGNVPGAGNSSSALNYQYIDNTLPEKTKADVFYYRLKQTDYDGQYTYSNIEVLTRGSITVIGPAPNPISDELNFTLVSANEGEIRIVIVDMLGQLVRQEIAAVQKGIQQIRVPLPTLSAGAYLLHISISDKTEKISKQFVIK